VTFESITAVKIQVEVFWAVTSWRWRQHGPMKR